MLCPKCKRENQPTSYFCTFCGAPLPTPEVEDPQEQLALREEMRRLRELVIAMNNRLAALEIMQGVVIPPPSKPTPATPSKAAVPIPAAEAPPRKGKPTRVEKREWEQIFGGTWLARIGILALVIGVAFFLKFAFDNNWLGPTGQIILGTIAGLGMLGLGYGYYWRKRYPILTQVFSGGGVAVLYLSIFAASAIYNMIHFYVAIALLLLVSMASAALALRYNSMALAIIGILGAFVAPFTLGMGEAWQLLAYVIVVDLGVLFLSTFRNWRWLTLLAHW
jgi:uncharacterized membrane protein